MLSSEDQSLLVRWDSLLVLDLGLHVLDGVGWLDVQGDGLASKSLDKDLHSSSQSEDQVKGGLLLDVVVSEGSSVLELLSGEDESLLVGWDALLVEDLLFQFIDSHGLSHLESVGLASKGTNENLLCV